MFSDQRFIVRNEKRDVGSYPRACRSRLQVQQEVALPRRSAEVKSQAFPDVVIWCAQLEFYDYASAPRIPKITQKSGFARWQSICFCALLINSLKWFCSYNFRKSGPIRGLFCVNYLRLERETGIEPATSSLGKWPSFDYQELRRLWH